MAQMCVRREMFSARADEMATVKEYAAVVRLHENTVRRLIREGKLRGAVRVGGQWRVDLSVALHVESF